MAIQAVHGSAQAQTTDTAVMISPDHFRFNEQTAQNNTFQNALDKSRTAVRARALREFGDMVQTLRDHNIRVICLPSAPNVDTPDACFPNNWFSHHQDGTLVLYPMFAPNRRLERQVSALLAALHGHDVQVRCCMDLSLEEEYSRFLEGTGSLVLDRSEGVAFALESPRTDRETLARFCTMMNYQPVAFRGYDRDGFAVYHTNVVMSVGDAFAVVCLDAICPEHRREVVQHLQGKRIVEIDLDQMHAFCANVLQMRSRSGDSIVVLSSTARNALRPQQLYTLKSFGQLAIVNIPTIEAVGGGSARCMLAEVFAGH